jgi:1,2-diacylglycerol 3-alpha-glucosyltransferase
MKPSNHFISTAMRRARPSTTALAANRDVHAAVLFHRLGPYHFARLKATATRLRVTAVDFSDVDSTYAWDLVEGADGFNRQTLFAGENIIKLPGTRIVSRVGEVLGQIRPDVVAIPGWYDRCSLAALQWCESRDVPVVVMSETTFWDEKRLWWKEWVKRRVIKLCSAGLVGGCAHAVYLENLGLSWENIFFGYDVVDNDFFSDRADEVRRRGSEVAVQAGLPERYFLASARFVEKKNLSRLIRAYAYYRELAQKPGIRPASSGPWSLILLGDGPLKPDLCRLISELGLQRSVVLPGFKQYDELPVAYALAGAFIHASTTEQWGLVVNEAMASGLPVLVSNRCGCASELVHEGVNGYSFDPCNIGCLAGLMLKFSALDFPLSEFGAASRGIIRNWSPEAFAEGMEAACECAIANRRKRGSRTARGILGLLTRVSETVIRAKADHVDRALIRGKRTLPPVMVVPNFFIIGAPKSGTTSLSEYLRHHPQIYFSSVKEPHYFDRDTSTRLKLSLQTYLSLFIPADPDLHKAVGEGSTGYLSSRVAVSEILRFNPNARFIVMLRNPVHLVQSWHAEMYFEGVENIPEFETAWTMEERRRRGKDIPPACWEPRKLFYSDWGRLGDQMERLFSIADRSRVKVIIFDDFVADPKRLYEDILEFLGMRTDGRTQFPTINENRSLRQAWLQRHLCLVANYFRQIRVASGLNLNLGLGWSRKLLFLNSEPAPRRPISPVFQAELEDFFRDDILKLSGILGRDLSGWVSRTPEMSEAMSIREH